MQELLDNMTREALAALKEVSTETELQAITQQYLGKNGELTAVLKGLGGLDPEARKTTGQAANQVKLILQTEIEAKRSSLATMPRCSIINMT